MSLFAIPTRSSHRSISAQRVVTVASKQITKIQLPSKLVYRTCIEEWNTERPTLVFFLAPHETSPVIWICITWKPASAIQSKLRVERWQVGDGGHELLISNGGRFKPAFAGRDKMQRPETGSLHFSCLVKTSFGHIPSIEQSKRDGFLQKFKLFLQFSMVLLILRNVKLCTAYIGVNSWSYTFSLLIVLNRARTGSFTLLLIRLMGSNNDRSPRNLEINWFKTQLCPFVRRSRLRALWWLEGRRVKTTENKIYWPRWDWEHHGRMNYKDTEP